MLEAYYYYVLLILLQIFFIIQLYYLIVVQSKLSSYKVSESSGEAKLPVSVIICARNEADNLKKNLPFIFSQKNIQFEVIVVNDCSYDRSDEVLRELQRTYGNLKVVVKDEHPRFKTGKKFAATLGIKAAEHEIVVFTDADCKPDSDNWLANICSNYNDEATEIVLGYSPYERKHGFLNLLIRYETFQTALNYLSFTLQGAPYMGVGRNLSYKKSLFFKGRGFASHMHIPSGDDDLFVNQNSNPTNTVIEIRPDAHVWSEPKTSWGSYWTQKVRHMGAGKEYRKKDKLKLSTQALSAMGFYVLIVTCLSLQIEIVFVGILFVLRLLTQSVVFYKSLLKLRYKDLLGWIIILDLFYHLYLSLLSIRGLFRKETVWK
ncbi:MAG: glycosyltransferase [Pedobacter sp.]|nr:MAG: glycosyltransferase [Pedobacter sp.]